MVNVLSGFTRSAASAIGLSAAGRNGGRWPRLEQFGEDRSCREKGRRAIEKLAVQEANQAGGEADGAARRRHAYRAASTSARIGVPRGEHEPTLPSALSTTVAGEAREHDEQQRPHAQAARPEPGNRQRGTSDA